MKQRLHSLDTLRGLTVAAMIVVNNPGSWENMYAPLDHAAWNGVTPTDFIFPFFMFIMGVSMCFSLKRFDYTLSAAATKKILTRGVGIYLIGLLIALSAQLGFHGAIDLSSLRLTGVLARLAVCYMLAAFLALTLKPRTLGILSVLLLGGYAALLLLCGGFEESNENILSRVDMAVLGSHMYAYHPAKAWNFDPEGLLSTIPGIAHVIWGFLVGLLLQKAQPAGKEKAPVSCNPLIETKILHLLLIGSAAVLAAFLLQWGCPLNKKVWSPTFVLATCGAACCLLAMLIWFIDVKGMNRGARFFDVVGVNPLFCYILADVYAIGFVAAKMPVGGELVSINAIIRQYAVAPVFGEGKLASLAFALVILMLTWIVALVLYRKKIYIKL